MGLPIGVGLGLAAGIMAGMLGIGGGVILVPGLVLLLGAEQHTAHGVSLVVIAATALVGGIAHYRQGNVKLKIAFWVAPAAIVFGLAGGLVAEMIPASLLTRAFAVLLLLSGFWLVIHK